MKIATRCVCCGSRDLSAVPAVLMPFLAYRIFGWQTTEVTADWNMRDLAPGRAYSLCNTLACGACGLLFLDMRFDDEEMAALYADYRGPVYEETRERFEPGYRCRNALLNAGSDYGPAIERFLAPHLPASPRILDWGGDTGINTPFRGRCRLHHILDISDKSVIAGAERIGPDQVRPGAYDLVVSANVLEHVSEPRAILEQMAAAMKPETVLYLEVPHEDLVRLIPEPADRPARKRHWHEHVNFFTDDALDVMLNGVGLACVARISHPISAGGKESHVFSLVARIRP